MAGYMAAIAAGMTLTMLAIVYLLGGLKTNPEYVVDFAGSIHDPLPIVVVTTCTQQPQSDPDYRAYCDIPGRRAVVVTPEDWDNYRMGSPYHG